MYDQHFLVDRKVLEKIINSADLKKSDRVLEIGVGYGVLTKELTSRCKVVGVEIDKKFEVEQDNLEIHYGNVLDLIDSLKFNKIVSNIPYSIIEPLMKKLIKRDLELCVLMIGEKFFNLTGKWSKIIPLFFKVEKVCTVSRSCFEPKPRVNSVVVKLVLKKELNEKKKLLKEFVLQDDKKVKNALKETFVRVKRMTKKEASLEIMKFPLNLMEKNVDYLSNKEFEIIYNTIIREQIL